MTDYSEQGAVPVEDAAVEDPPTVDEVLAEQRKREHDAGDEGDQDDEGSGETAEDPLS